MFGIDAATFHTLWPSVLIIVMMIGAMGWGIAKVIYLVSHSRADAIDKKTLMH